MIFFALSNVISMCTCYTNQLECTNIKSVFLYVFKSLIFLSVCVLCAVNTVNRTCIYCCNRQM